MLYCSIDVSLSGNMLFMFSKLPNFFVIGAAKCGTSTICHILGQHPDVFMSDPKEPHFFGRDDPVKTWDWYAHSFEGAGEAIAIGEGSTSYTHPNIIERVAREIWEYGPTSRLIYMVRHPIRRLESDWRMRTYEGWAGGSINEAVKTGGSLLSHGMYWRNLNFYRQLFEDEQILIIFLEDLASDPASTLRRCFEHLGVSPEAPIENRRMARNKSSELRQDGHVVRILKDSSLRNLLTRLVPPGVKQHLMALLTSKLDVTLNWDTEAKRIAVDSFREDAQKFLSFCDKSPAFWNLEDNID